MAFVVTSLSDLRAADDSAMRLDIDGTNAHACGLDDYLDPDGSVGLDSGVTDLALDLQREDSTGCTEGRLGRWVDAVDIYLAD